MQILGISAFYHDSAAALVEDGRIVAAAQEDRFTRRKHDPRFPSHAARDCLQAAGIGVAEVDRAVVYDKPFLQFERLLQTFLACAARGLASFAMALRLRERLCPRQLPGGKLKPLSGGADVSQRLLFTQHRRSPAASAFSALPFGEALVLTADGAGEWATAPVERGRGLNVLRRIHFPHSLGMPYSAFTDDTGFQTNSGECPSMGPASYGEPKYEAKIPGHLIDVKEDRSFRLNPGREHAQHEELKLNYTHAFTPD